MERIRAAAAAVLGIQMGSHRTQSADPVLSHPYTDSHRLVATPWEGLHVEAGQQDLDDAASPWTEDSAPLVDPRPGTSLPEA